MVKARVPRVRRAGADLTRWSVLSRRSFNLQFSSVLMAECTRTESSSDAHESGVAALGPAVDGESYQGGGGECGE